MSPSGAGSAPDKEEKTRVEVVEKECAIRKVQLA